MLLYPCLQAIDFNLPSYIQNSDDPYLDRDFMISFWLWYVQGTSKQDVNKCKKNQHLSEADVERICETIDYSLLGTDQIHIDNGTPSHLLKPDTDQQFKERLTAKLLDPLMSPLLAKDVQGLPETYILTCEQDVVKDEGFLYAKRLQRDGVKVHHEHLNVVHGFFDFQDLKYTQDVLKSVIGYLKKTLH